VDRELSREAEQSRVARVPKDERGRVDSYRDAVDRTRFSRRPGAPDELAARVQQRRSGVGAAEIEREIDRPERNERDGAREDMGQAVETRLGPRQELRARAFRSRRRCHRRFRSSAGRLRRVTAILMPTDRRRTMASGVR
jgi:hypothetical protein